MKVEWHLINGLTGMMMCKWVDEQTARDWLSKQLELYPDGYYKETQARIERYPELKEGQIDLFDLLIA